MNTQEENLSNVVRELGVDQSTPRTTPISKARIERLMEDEDIEVLGAVYTFVTEERRSKTIQPSLQFEDYYRFMTHYYERCFREDPKSHWADSRFSAGHDLVNWFAPMGRQAGAPKRPRKSEGVARATLRRRGRGSSELHRYRYAGAPL